MNLITIDFETYYDRDYSLKKLTMEEYIRDSRFEIIGIGIKVNNEETMWASGTHEQLHDFLQEFDWGDSAVLAHNTMFDGAILSWLFNIRPKLYLDTLCMARAVHGVDTFVSLAALVKKHKLGTKGTEVLDALGIKREDFTEQQLGEYGDYCVNDVDLTHALFKKLSTRVPKQELRLVDLTLRMFIQPELELDLPLLEQHLSSVKNHKKNLLVKCGTDRTVLMSNPKFANKLEELGVQPPEKISPTTGQTTHAFSKSDEEFKKLLTDPNPDIRNLIEARLSLKSTLEETRTQRFIDIAKRGSLPVPLRYYAAHTGRWGGDDKINMQNLSSRGKAKILKHSIVAPKGYMLIDCDSSQIEARVLAWLAEQEDLVEAFANKEDVYVKMASKIYDIDEAEVTKEQRFVGKTTILGCGYGMGHEKFKDQLQTFGTDIELSEAKRIIQVYRETNYSIFMFWKKANRMLKDMMNNCARSFGVDNIVKPVRMVTRYSLDKNYGIKLPSGLCMRYSDMKESNGEFSYKGKAGRTKIYGGKVTENVCQAIARCIIGEQMLKIAERYKVVLTVHDSVVCCVPENDLDDARHYVEKCMSTTPEWAEGLPITCESGVGKSYGQCGG